MQIERIKRFEIIELLIDVANPGRFTFDPQAQLRNDPDQVIIIKGIQVYPDTIYSNSQESAAIPGVAMTELPKAVLTLYVDGEESVKGIPLVQLVNQQDNNNPSLFQQEIQQFADLKNVVWEKSYVQFSVAPAGVSYIIPFGITYIRMKRDATSPTGWIEA